MKAKKSSFDFETSLKKLEQIVATMEQGNLSLEESLKMFQEGIALTKKCQEAISNVEQQVMILVDDHLEDFNAQTENSNEHSPSASL